jgi:hypothetical protein
MLPGLSKKSNFFSNLIEQQLQRIKIQYHKVNPEHPMLSDLEAWAEFARPVFIGGMERSGTSMMLRSISNHPAFYSINSDTETFIFSRTILTPLPIPIHPEAVEFMGGWKVAELWINHVNKLLDGENLFLKGMNNQLVVMSRYTDTKKPSLQAMKSIILSYFYTIHRLNKDKRIVEKTPINAFQLSNILSFFPRSKFIGMIRNPLWVVASMRRRYRLVKEMGYKYGGLMWMMQSTESYIKKFNWIQNAFRKAKQKWPDNIILCNYHELTHDPIRGMQEIAERLDVPFHKSLLGKELDEVGLNPLNRKCIQPNDYDVSEFLSEQEIVYIKRNADYEF